MSYQNKSIKVFKELLSVMRSLTKTSCDQVSGYKQTYGYSYFASVYRNHKNVCNENTAKELHFLGETYLCLLKSVKDGEILHQRYKGAGEHSVEEIASRVGFKLPCVPKPTS